MRTKIARAKFSRPIPDPSRLPACHMVESLTSDTVDMWFELGHLYVQGKHGGPQVLLSPAAVEYLVADDTLVLAPEPSPAPPVVRTRKRRG